MLTIFYCKLPFSRLSKGQLLLPEALFFLLAGAICLPKPCQAQSLFEWINTSGAFYDVGSNWLPTGPPSTIDVAQFLPNATYEVRWDSLTASLTPDVGFVDVGTGIVTFQNQDSTQHGFTINNDLTLFDGAHLTNSGLDLNVIGSTFIISGATLLVEGNDPAGTQFNASGPMLIPDANITFDNGAVGDLDPVQLNVDSEGLAFFNVLGGSSVVVDRFRMGDGSSQPANSAAVLNVSGVDSSLFLSDPSNVFLGNDGSSGLQTISITDGGKMQFDDEAIVAIERRAELVVSAGFFGNEFLSIFDDLSLRITGSMNVQNGGLVASSTGSVLFGEATISGMGSAWETVGFFSVRAGELLIESGGRVSSGQASIAFLVSSPGSIATVQDSGSHWTIDGSFNVGEDDAGELHILSGGQVSNGFGAIGTEADGVGVVNVSGIGSQWSNAALVVGNQGEGTLTVDNGGLVTVNSFTEINLQSTVNLDGGRFEFGSMDYDNLNRVVATGGSMAGTVNLDGVNDIASLDGLQNSDVDLTEVAVSNVGLLLGSTILGCALNNEADGELRTTATDWVRFEGNANVNEGEINNFGGMVDFAQDFTNDITGFVGGRGQFSAGASWTNAGVMAFSGTTDILGDFENLAGGQIVTSGGATTTFFDDVIHNGDEIRTSEGCSTVFLGQLGGAGSFTGLGTVYLEGDLRPGNSPDTLEFEGNFVLGSTTVSVFEIAGTDVELFDRLMIDGNLTLDGSLTVELIDGFLLAPEQQFVIAEVAGNLFGQFVGLADDSLVGTFNGQDLFISYSAGDGNDIALYTTAVPPLAGDVNLDGAVNLLDVDPFIERIASGVYQVEADCNQDGVVNLLDVNPFVGILSGS